MSLRWFVLFFITIGTIEIIAFSVSLLLSIDIHKAKEVRRELASGGSENFIKPTLMPGANSGATHLLMDPHPFFGFTYKEGKGIPKFVKRLSGGDILQFSKETDFNIVITGGSLADTFYNKMTKEVKSFFEELLNDKENIAQTRVNVICFAVSSHKQPQQLHSLTYFLTLGAKIDLIINIDGFNEFAGAYENHSKKTFFAYPTSWRKYLYKFSLPQNLVIGKIQFTRQIQRGFAKGMNTKIISKSLTGTVFWVLIDRYLENTVNGYLEEWDNSLKQQELSPIGYPKNLEMNEFMKSACEVWMRASLLMNSIAGEYNITYIHVLQPNQYVPGSKGFTEKQKKMVLCRGSDSRIEEGYTFLKEFGNILKEKENFIDATMIFANTKEDTYADCVCHINLRGNQILWGRIKEFILNELKPFNKMKKNDYALDSPK